MLASALAPLAALNAYLSTPVHPLLYPFPWATTIHALRVSLAYRHLRLVFTQRRRSQSHDESKLQVGLLRDAAGFLVMAWGGSFLSHYTVQQIPPQLLSVFPLLHYLSVYFGLTLLLSLFPALTPTPRQLDLTLPILDGAIRSFPVVSGLNLVRNHPNPAARSSLFLQILCATLSASGGGIAAFTLNVFDPLGWSFSTPPFLTYTRLVEFTDILAPLAAALLHGLATYAHPAYTPVLSKVHFEASPLLSPEGGRALVSLVIATAFFAKAVVLHLLGPAAPAPAAQEKAKRAVASSGNRSSTPVMSGGTPARNTRSAKAGGL